jgi:hypothetical protein
MLSKIGLSSSRAFQTPHRPTRTIRPDYARAEQGKASFFDQMIRIFFPVFHKTSLITAANYVKQIFGSLKNFEFKRQSLIY